MMYKKVSFFVFSIFYILWAGLAEAAPIRIEAARVGQHKDMTRVVLESDKPLKPKLFTLRKPYRVVLDFQGELDIEPVLDHVKRPPKSLVQGMRAGTFKPGVTRMVLDVGRAVAVTKFVIPASRKTGYRLVLDLTPTTTMPVMTAVDTTKSKDEKPSKNSMLFGGSKAESKASRPPKGKRRLTYIMIDPGHGGVDPGAVTPSKTYEKNIVLSVSKRLERWLDAQPGFAAKLTRKTDIYIPLGERVKMAHDFGADIFVSIHADAHRNRKVKGGSVYVLSEKSSDKEAARLAAAANKGDEIAGLDLSHESADVRGILIDLTQRETMNRSALLAKDVLAEMDKKIHLRKKRPQFAGFRVLKAPDIPSVLVELAYLSNRSEERLLKQKSHQQKLAEAVGRGIVKFAKGNVHKEGQ